MPAQHRLLSMAAALMSLSSAVVVFAPAPVIAQQSREAWLQRQFAAYDSQSLAAPVGAPDSVAEALATWDWLRRTPRVGAEPSLQTQAQFLTRYADWPSVTTIRRRAEAQAADPLKTSDAQALAHFRQITPESSAGMARYALLSSGADAFTYARAAWTRTGVPSDVESQLLSRFGSNFTVQDHARRADVLIWAGQTSAARRMLTLVDPDTRRVLDTRLAYRGNSPDAASLYNALPARLQRDSGLAYDRLLAFERQGQLSSAESLLAEGLTDPGVAAPVTWLDKRLVLGRAAMRRGSVHVAYRILANHKAYNASTNLSELSLTERVRLSDTEWLAGWIALRRLNQPETAARHFTEFNRIVTSPVSRSRGDYWLGRAEKARGNKQAADVAFERAATHFDYFYGQLAAEELNRTPQLPMVPIIKLTNAERNAFESKPLAAALKTLVQMGDSNRAALIVRALADSTSTPTEARLSAELGQKLNRPDLGVWTWKAARPRGDFSTFDLAFPRLPTAATITPRDWFIVHAITRQESSFDRTAQSPVGARGLMQLMPDTASDVSTKLGIPYSRERLFTDPAYNVSLGNYYIGLRRDNFTNVAMAIAAYNAGAGNARKWVSTVGDPRTTMDPIDWVEMIPFSETRNYVQRVTENGVVYSMLEPNRPYAEKRASRWLRGY